MYGMELERGLDHALASDIIEYDPRRSVTLKKAGSRRLQKKRVVSPALVILKDKEADRRGAVDSVCHFPESRTHSKLPPVTVQYTLQLRNVDKLDRFVRLAQFRGGKHLYVMVDPGNEDEYPYHLFIAARLLREELCAIATDTNPHAIWIFHINRKYKVTVYREPHTVIARFKRRLEQRRQSKTRVRGNIIAIKHGHGFIAPVDGGNTVRFDFDNVVDPSLRLVLQNADRHNRRNIVFSLRVSFESARDPASDTTHAISILGEEDLSAIKKTLFDAYVARDNSDDSSSHSASI